VTAVSAVPTVSGAPPIADAARPERAETVRKPVRKPVEPKIYVAPPPPDDPGLDASDAADDPVTGYGPPIKGPA
jgi:hypothetical protein